MVELEEMAVPFAIGFAAGVTSSVFQYITQQKDENADGRVDWSDVDFAKMGRTALVAGLAGGAIGIGYSEPNPVILGFIAASLEKGVGVVVKTIRAFLGWKEPIVNVSYTPFNN